MKNTFLKLLLLIFIFFIPVQAFCDSTTTDTTPEEYSKDEFPTAMQDLRRFEIISLGALPFVTLDTTLVYSGIRYAQHGFDSSYMPNPFASASEGGFTTEEQFGVIVTSLGISIGIGLTDFIIRLIKRSSQKKKISRTRNNDLTITSIAADPDAVNLSKILDKTDPDSKQYDFSDSGSSELIEVTD